MAVPGAIIEGTATCYELIGSGPPLLIFAPDGFKCDGGPVDQSRVYARTKLDVKPSGDAFETHANATRMYLDALPILYYPLTKGDLPCSNRIVAVFGGWLWRWDS